MARGRKPSPPDAVMSQAIRLRLTASQYDTLCGRALRERTPVSTLIRRSLFPVSKKSPPAHPVVNQEHP